MKRFFYSDGVNQFGPFTLDELKSKNLNPDTLIWYQGLDEWLPASEAPVIKEELGFVRKAVVDISDEDLQREKEQMIRSEKPFDLLSKPVDRMPHTWLVEAILVTIFCCMPLGIVGIIYAAQVETKFKNGDLPGAKKASDNAALFTKISFFLTLAFIAFYFIMLLGLAI